jgi:hypothetical protein
MRTLAYPIANFYKPKAATDPIKMIATGVGHHPRVLLVGILCT